MQTDADCPTLRRLQLDNPDSPTNDLPYSLTIKIGKPTPIAREGGTETAPKGSVWHARSGDVLTIMQKNNKEAKIKCVICPLSFGSPVDSQVRGLAGSNGSHST